MSYYPWEEKMKKTVVLLVFALLSFSLVAFTLFESSPTVDAKYIGAKKCGMCHKAKTGDQLGIWEKSLHAKAYKTLQSDAAKAIVKEKGLGEDATKVAECLACHVTGAGKDASKFEKSFSIEEGVSCEACHGAGSEYKSKKIMEDHAASVANGMTEYKTEADIEAQCKTCHNEKSPTFKGFKFKEAWAKIAHPTKEG